MPPTAGSGKKPNAINEPNDALYDPYPELTVDFELFAKVPWPEWSDAELNAEVWEEPKVKSTASGAKNAIPSAFFPVAFEDPDPPELPPQIMGSVYSWKRPQEVFAGANLTVFDASNGEFELRVPSSVAEYDFFNYFCEVLPILQFYATKYGFPVELETPVFVPTTQGEPWRPWHHVYALCKAGKGQIHKPAYCSYGKYVLRIFYMGSWRRFVVDDRIPCDIYGNCMLPVTQVSGELWPILLTKALLKIISLTPTIDLSRIDFPFLSLFTGWISVRMTIVNKTSEQVWRRFLLLLPRFEIPDEEPESKISIKEVASKKGSSKKESSKGLDKKAEKQSEMFSFVLATLEGFPEEEKLSASHTIGITMCRDVPLVKANKREDTKTWKRIRWVYWATKKGIWTDELKMPPYRRLQHITFVKDLAEYLAPNAEQEAAMFDIPTRTFSSNPSNLSVQDDQNFGENQDEQWLDFFKLQEHLFELNILLKPSFFTSMFKVSCLKTEMMEKSRKSSTGKNELKAPPQQQNFYFQSPNLMPTCNEPALVLCESLTGIFLCISLWVCPQITTPWNLDTSRPELLKIGHATVIVERFDWRTVEQGEIIGLLTTVGNSSLVLHLKPGRHILKLWLNAACSYVINIHSNVEVVVHKSSRIRFMMGRESVRILHYIDNVSNAFINLTQKFGKPEFAEALRDFYNAIKPGNDTVVGYYGKIDEFIEVFLNCILLTLQSLVFSIDELRIMMGALRCLFLNPAIQCDLPRKDPPSSIYGGSKKVTKKTVSVIKERTLSEILSYPWSSEEISMVVTIQRVFRGFRVRLLWKCQTPERKEFKFYCDRLRKVCDAVFAPAKREMEVGRLIRRVVTTNYDLLPTFKFHEDFPKVIQVEEYTGKIPNVEPFAWVPIARFIIASHCPEPVPCSFYVSCNLEQRIILGVDNDTNEELFRLTNSVSAHYYQRNVKGYTIFVFGWNEANVKTVNWRLEMVRMKHFDVIHLCNTLLGLTCHPYTIPSLEVFEVKNFYVPNHKSRICRCLIRIQKRTLLTIRLSTSYSEAQFVLIISLDKKFVPSDSDSSSDKVIAQSQCTNGAVLLSTVLLDHFEPNSLWSESSTDYSTVYILEAFVINQSWPLTKQEWGMVEPIRVNGESWKDSTTNVPSRKGGSESRKKLTRTSRRSLSDQKPVENPFWLLQVLNDASEGTDSGEQVVVEEDRSYAESVKAMKMSWEERNPGRRKRGRDLRFKFLQMIFQEENQNLEAEGVFEETDKDSEKEVEYREDFKTFLEKMSSFSYLTNDPSPERYVKSPRVLPPMPTQELLNKYKKQTNAEEESVVVDDLSDTSLLRNMAQEAEEDRKDFLNKCVHYRQVMVDHWMEELKLSSQLMEQAYEGRLKAIERLSRWMTV